MDHESPYAGDEGRSSRRGRFMDKLFGGRDRKSSETSSQASLDAFLQGSSLDKLEVTHAPPPPPPKLAKLDTTISRYPQALAVNQQAQHNRPLAPGIHESALPPRPSPRPNKKGLFVRFADSYPDIIGEGGDESEVPVLEVSKTRVARQQSTATRPPPGAPSVMAHPFLPPPRVAGAIHIDFSPKPLARTQTGYSSIYEPENDGIEPPDPSLQRSQSNSNTLVPGGAASARYLETSGRRDENRRSFIEVHQAQMRAAEGQAFAQAARTVSVASGHRWEDGERPTGNALDQSPVRQPSSSPGNQNAPPPITYSPAASISSNASSTYFQDHDAPRSMEQTPSGGTTRLDYAAPAPPLAARMASVKLHNAVDAIPKSDALNIFISRTRHLFELFRLHAEAVKPLQACLPRQCTRAALWWFLKGRMGLELAVRDRPASPQAQMQNTLDRQQAWSNLAKSYWLCQEIMPRIAQLQGLSPESDVAAAVQAMLQALRKLSQSMDRNGLLPPEEPFLPQTIDKSIWLDYPPLSQDMVALLSGDWSSGFTAMQQPLAMVQLLDALPLGDTSESFNYGRVMADVFLMEQGRDAQRVHLPCIMSIVRPPKQKGLAFMIASQNDSVQLAIQESNKSGPGWDDVRWRPDSCALDIRLPRGFLLAVKLSQPDYKTAKSMHDFSNKLNSTLHPTSDEHVVFRNTLRSFQYIEAEPLTRAFPKEAVSHCEVALFERVFKENGPAGQRTWHRGYRIAVVTGPRTRTVSGVQHAFPPSMPIQFGFFRAEGDMPALSVRYESGRQRGRMVLMFNDEKERAKFHSLLSGTALNHDERLFADVALKSFMISQSIREPFGVAPFSRMPWKAARVVNDEFSHGGEQPATVLADRLRVVLEYQNGTMTDRTNVAPGELRMRLEVSNTNLLRVLRQPQQDVTMSASEAQVPKELVRNMYEALQLLKSNATIRTYEFNRLKDLHDFQAALTGFEVIFDSLATTFAIARRRMVVPIHKKWEAGSSRIQIVKLEDRQLQLLAFFEDFQHGHCMNLVLKGTDVYESFHRGGKSGVKFVDAKFPLPRLPADRDGDFDEMAFVCLDLPDLPGEHDDITIMFENESDRDRLCECLPAPVKGSSRMSSRLK
ncbi:hypothetical protein CDD82_1132 [Ophiocordyceps australis]|uniref:Uncharacterized protein n=1 Tax=Ophiocordyceps australis TaxID=1399860 RepID=A0A2C5YKG9_9HYPO|nr:hypothetical protein CDD82_1132 [Ophiocordyceps australis]